LLVRESHHDKNWQPGVVPRSNEFGDSVRVLWGEFGFYWRGDEPLVNTWNLEIETKTFPRCTLLISDSRARKSKDKNEDAALPNGQPAHMK
jgi:hypothetical protein